MKKINTFSTSLGQGVDILSTTQMAVIKGGLSANDSVNVDAPVGPLSATADDKRRDRPGGGVSTH